MQKFDKFVNELNTETYLAAADIADERGELFVGDDLRGHAEDMEQTFCQDCGDELVDGGCVNCDDEERGWEDNPALDNVPAGEEPLVDEVSFFEMKSFNDFANESYDEVLDGGMEEMGASDVPVGPSETGVEEIDSEGSYGDGVELPVDGEVPTIEEEMPDSEVEGEMPVIDEEEEDMPIAYEGMKSFDSFSVNEEEDYFGGPQDTHTEVDMKCKDCGTDCSPEEEYCADCEQNHMEDLGEPNDTLGDDNTLANDTHFEGVKTFDKF